jgi:AhpD family alkylhydroperoxidase
LVTAGENECNYCASAHTLMGKGAGVAPAELAANLRGTSGNAKTQAALNFAKVIVAERGRVADADLAEVRAAGYSEAEITEIVATVAANIFTNYFNHIADTEVDFPLVNATALETA